MTKLEQNRFRPQQGLTIMNQLLRLTVAILILYRFPSPTGVNYYESDGLICLPS